MRADTGGRAFVLPCPQCATWWSTEQTLAGHLIDAHVLAPADAVTRALETSRETRRGQAIKRGQQRAQEEEATPTESLRFFVAGKLRNPLNGSWGDWRKHWRVARDWRERTATALLVAYAYRRGPVPLDPMGDLPKHVTFTAHVGRLWDTDNLPGAVKPIRDGLVDSRLIHSDAPTSGHLFEYEQIVDRTRRGVEVEVRLR